MARDWKEIKKEIEAELDKIWFDEPEEVTKSKLGIFQSGAGTDGQYLGNLFFLTGDTQAMGWWTIEPGMYAILGDDDFTLAQCKKMFKYLNYEMARLMGSVCEPGCPAPWLNLPKMWKWNVEIVEAYDTIKTKAQFKSLLWSWFNYVDRINRWFYTVFPWELGQSMPRKDIPYLDKLAGYQGYKVVKK